MARAKTAERLVRMAKALLGWIPGGLALMTVWTCAFFTIFTGASGVTIVALGGLLLPELERSRYSRRFSIEVVTGSGAVGLLFPPALPLIVYGIVFGAQRRPGRTSSSRSSASSCAGIVPGLLLLAHPSVYCIVEGWRSKVPTTNRSTCPSSSARAVGSEVGGADPLRHPRPAARRARRAPGVAALTALYVFVVEVFVYRTSTSSRDLFAVTRESMTPGRRHLHEDRRRRPS